MFWGLLVGEKTLNFDPSISERYRKWQARKMKFKSATKKNKSRNESGILLSEFQMLVKLEQSLWEKCRILSLPSAVLNKYRK